LNLSGGTAPPRRLISRWDAASLRAANGGGYQVPFDQKKALGQGWRGRKVEARESHPRASVSMTLSLILDIPLIRGGGAAPRLRRLVLLSCEQFYPPKGCFSIET